MLSVLNIIYQMFFFECVYKGYAILESSAASHTWF